MPVSITDTLFDASSLINLVNGGVLDPVLRLPQRRWYAGPLVFGECHKGGQLPAEVAAERQARRIIEVPAQAVSVSLFIQFGGTYRLGDGETECLTVASSAGYAVCCDDRLARRMLMQELGPSRVTGSLGVLREAVAGGLLSKQDALLGYFAMLAGGAFLPSIQASFFD